MTEVCDLPRLEPLGRSLGVVEGDRHTYDISGILQNLAGDRAIVQSATIIMQQPIGNSQGIESTANAPIIVTQNS
jgi:hypothetical protein